MQFCSNFEFAWISCDGMKGQGYRKFTENPQKISEKGFWGRSLELRVLQCILFLIHLNAFHHASC